MRWQNSSDMGRAWVASRRSAERLPARWSRPVVNSLRQRSGGERTGRGMPGVGGAPRAPRDLRRRHYGPEETKNAEWEPESGYSQRRAALTAGGELSVVRWPSKSRQAGCDGDSGRPYVIDRGERVQASGDRGKRLARRLIGPTLPAAATEEAQSRHRMASCRLSGCRRDEPRASFKLSEAAVRPEGVGNSHALTKVSPFGTGDRAWRLCVLLANERRVAGRGRADGETRRPPPRQIAASMTLSGSVGGKTLDASRSR